MLPNAGTSGMQCHTGPLKCGNMVSQCFQPIQTFRKELYRLLKISKLCWLVFCLWLSISSVCAPFSQLQLKSRYRKRNTNHSVFMLGFYHKQKFHLPADFPETLEPLCQGFLPLPQNRAEQMGRDAEAQEGPKGEVDTRVQFKKRSSTIFLFPTHLHAQFPAPPAHSQQDLLGLLLAHCPSPSNSMGASFLGGSINMSSFSFSLTSDFLEKGNLFYFLKAYEAQTWVFSLEFCP